VTSSRSRRSAFSARGEGAVVLGASCRSGYPRPLSRPKGARRRTPLPLLPRTISIAPAEVGHTRAYAVQGVVIRLLSVGTSSLSSRASAGGSSPDPSASHAGAEAPVLTWSGPAPRPRCRATCTHRSTRVLKGEPLRALPGRPRGGEALGWFLSVERPFDQSSAPLPQSLPSQHPPRLAVHIPGGEQGLHRDPQVVHTTTRACGVITAG